MHLPKNLNASVHIITTRRVQRMGSKGQIPPPSAVPIHPPTTSRGPLRSGLQQPGAQARPTTADAFGSWYWGVLKSAPHRQHPSPSPPGFADHHIWTTAPFPPPALSQSLCPRVAHADRSILRQVFVCFLPSMPHMPRLLVLFRLARLLLFVCLPTGRPHARRWGHVQRRAELLRG
jgi:hypothetical protein